MKQMKGPGAAFVSKPGILLAVICVVLVLAGCSGAPDADDVAPLLENQLRQQLDSAESTMRALGGESGVDLMRAMGAPDPADIHVENVEILESRALEHDDYELDMRYDIVTADARRVQTTTVRVNEGDNGWRLLP
ncbi:hypothetical protein S4A8_14609 [Salinisphaera sp. S4-8]|uniref:hypothetical protein n=1 Tax=Salinisphaera sp. S4-8 TaxID=633357 RepID=UPI00333EC105